MTNKNHEAAFQRGLFFGNRSKIINVDFIGFEIIVQLNCRIIFFLTRFFVLPWNRNWWNYVSAFFGTYNPQNITHVPDMLQEFSLLGLFLNRQRQNFKLTQSLQV